MSPPADASSPIQRDPAGDHDQATSRRRSTADWGARSALAALTLGPGLIGLVLLFLVLAGLIRLVVHPIRASVVLVVAGAGLYWLVGAAMALRRARPARLIGAELTMADQPRIWAVVDELTADLGVPPVQRMVVDGGAATALTWGGRSHRELMIGLPLLVGLDQEQFAAMLAHELAHELPPDRAGRVVYRLGHRIEIALAATTPGVRRSLLQRYATVYRRLAGPADQRLELAADDRAADLTGPDVLASAVHRVETLRLAWQVLLEEYLPLSARAGRRPGLAEGVRNILGVRGPALGRQALAQAGRRTMFDAHPAPEVRMARLSARPPGAVRPDRAAPAVGLLDGGEATIAILERSILVDDDAMAGWPEIAERAALVDLHMSASELARAAAGIGLDRPVTLDTLLAAIERGQGAELAEPLLRPGIPAAERPAEAQRVLAQAVDAFVALVLTSQGRAGHLLTWTGPPVPERLRGSEWVRWDARGLIEAAAADPAAVEPLIGWLIAAGADLKFAVDAAPQPMPRVLSAMTDVELAGPFEARRIDLVVYDTGLLLAPAPTGTALGQVRERLPFRLPRTVSPAQRVIALAEQLDGRPEDLPGGWWIEFGVITFSQLRERRTGLDLELRMKDGASATVHTLSATSERGVPVDDLRRLLPALRT